MLPSTGTVGSKAGPGGHERFRRQIDLQALGCDAEVDQIVILQRQVENDLVTEEIRVRSI
jgi:hypothetical protein